MEVIYIQHQQSVSARENLFLSQTVCPYQTLFLIFIGLIFIDFYMIFFKI